MDSRSFESFDPNRATAPEMTRAAFVNVSAGLFTATGIPTPAAGVQTPLGAPHAPIVAEDDPALEIERPTLQSAGASIDAYAAIPKDAVPDAPGIVLVQHIWGVDAQIRDVVRRFAKQGYVTIAPDLYARGHAPNGDGATDYTLFRPFAQALVDSEVDDDLRAGCAWIRARAGRPASGRPPKVAIAGFCMGGAIALREASVSPQFDAAAIWYGRVRQNTSAAQTSPDAALAYIDEIAIPICGSYGGRDTSIPVEDVDELRRRLKTPNDIKVYPEAGHAFFDDTRPSYVATAAADSWTRVLAWFAKYLRA